MLLWVRLSFNLKRQSVVTGFPQVVPSAWIYSPRVVSLSFICFENMLNLVLGWLPSYWYV